MQLLRHSKLYHRVLYWVPLSIILGMQTAIGQEAEAIVENGTNYLIDVFGPLVFLLGLIVAGFSLATGSQNGVVKGIYAIAGGLCILGARAILSTISSFVN